MGVASYVFFGGMIDGAVRFEFFTDSPIDPAFVGSKMRPPRGHSNDQRPDSLSRDIRDVERASLTIALD
jgi:hypothetical protein